MIESCVLYARTLYTGEINDQQKAADFYYGWMQHPDRFKIALEILEQYDDLYSNYAALNIFNNLASNNWLILDIELRNQLKDQLYAILDDNREPVIVNICSKVISRIAINEFPETWKDFLFETLTYGNSMILIYFLEELESNLHIPQYRRTLTHDLIMASFDIINATIFDRLEISASSVHLYALLSAWAPLNRITNEKAIRLLTTRLLMNEETRNEAIECLDLIFVKRFDCDEIFPKIHHLLLTNLYEASKQLVEAASLMADILVQHIKFFLKNNEIYYKVEKEVQPEEEEDILVINIGPPKKEIIEVKEDKYMFYDSFKDCFLLLSDPGWDIELEKYWTIWRSFLEFAQQTNLPKESNHIINFIPKLFSQMFNIIHTVHDDEYIINNDAKECFHMIYQIEPNFVIDFFQNHQNSQPNVSLLYLICCYVEKMPPDLAFQLIDPFLIPGTNILPNVLHCMAYFFRYLPENYDYIFFFSNSITSVLKSLPYSQNCLVAISNALQYLVVFSNQIFYLEDNLLLNNLVSLISSININFIGNQAILSLYNVVACAIIEITDEIESINLIEKSLNNITSFIYTKCKDILHESQQVFSLYVYAIILLKEFSKRCFRLTQIEGDKLVDALSFLISSNEITESNSVIIEHCYELLESLFLGYFDWNEVEKNNSFQKVLIPAYAKKTNHYGHALKFLTTIHTKFIESELIFINVYENIIKPLMLVITDGSQYVLDYLLSVNIWNYSYLLPIDFMEAVVREFPHDCTRSALIMIQKYCLHFHFQAVQVCIHQENEKIFRFLTELLLDPFYNSYFSQLVSSFMAFFYCCYKLQFEEIPLKMMMLKVLKETLPSFNVDDVYNTDNELENENQNNQNENQNNQNENQNNENHFDQLFIDFINYSFINFSKKLKMEVGLKYLIMSSHCYHPTMKILLESPHSENEAVVKDLSAFVKSILSEDNNTNEEQIENEDENNIVFNEAEITEFFDMQF
ncbi:hypothetical protein TRFO_32167 [Tritrichomonas foetus]|uniref:Exportin-1/Importin-beta-like domain-containing protein n=1 Tax=Tritrichomonas foetus TaxID=1144522 RepID=A0A1J4JRB1_9EUKA|nr:hypothetical protein TRFO_32167 [Tritrichomonas foetus]|eukprot:OHT00960.1 hypothetical protein TRFO_32167 [Tritrichomonas foetus]